MLLTGTFHRSLDDKLRFTLPKTLRDIVAKAGELVLFLAPGTDGSLVAYTESAFLELGEKLGQQSPTSQDIRAFSRLFYAQAQRVEVDRQGRVRIPSELTDLALSDRDIVLLGVRDHLEIWDRGRWEAYLHGKQPDYDAIAESALGGAGSGPTSLEKTSEPVRSPQPR